jgi:hypothetical protein
MQSTQKNPTELALGFLAAAFTDFAPNTLREILAPDYIQHVISRAIMHQAFAP